MISSESAAMRCMVCKGSLQDYFSKNFGDDPLRIVAYMRCRECGFTCSSNHFALPMENWERLNTEWHEQNNRLSENPWNREQRHFNQALMLYLLKRGGIIPYGNWLDYASGQGGLAKQLDLNFDLKLSTYDPYIPPELFPLGASELTKGSYSLVTNTAMFEHARDRSTLDEIESYVAKDGCFGIHTLVRGEIPKDPEWMYLLPVHCSFFTNKSMQMLMDQWGYSCSIYSEHSKLWIWFKSDPDAVREKVLRLNAKLGWQYLHFKIGFMDYWP